MKKLTFTLQVNAPREKVWKILWEDATYRQWTTAFTEGSHAVSDWQEGSKILFLSPGGSGMVSRIARMIPNELMIFEHLGEIKNGVEDLTAAWAGAQEEYQLKSDSNGTMITVLLDSDEEIAYYFSNTFPKAMAIVKQLAEN